MTQIVDTALPEATDDGAVESLGHGVTRQWILNHKVVVFTLDNFTRVAIDAWVQALKDTVMNWPTKHAYVINDFSPSQMILMPPYMRVRTLELRALAEARPNGCTAVVLPRSFVANLLKLIIDGNPPDAPGEFRLFLSLDKATAWIQAAMSKQG